jgi:peptidoglycan hydrolase-like protein with peptidoglycan-binding domain
MKKYIGILFVLSLLIITPGFSFAQVGDVDPNPASDCLSLVNNLRYRDRDINKNGEVSALQDFLQSEGYLNSEPTGYFGLLTFKAAKAFQKANGINPTGYVGPITRAKIQTLTCSGTVPTPTIPIPITPIPTVPGCTSGQNYNSMTGQKCAIPIPIPTSLTVLSPNGGETWVKGTTQTIKWQDNTTSTCQSGAICNPAPRQFDIYLLSTTSSTKNYTIASNVSGYGSSRSFSWEVDQADGLSSNSMQIPDGLYTIQVCVSGAETYQCDSSDSSFKIASSATGPTISGISGPQSLNVNQVGTWTVTASDSSGGILSYSVDWGEYKIACSSKIPCAASITTQTFQQSATFTHSYATTGI